MLECWFIDFSSAFNTIIPQQLINKLNLLGLNNSLCNWILDFLTGRPQSVRVGHNTSSTTTLNTGAPQGCVLSPLLFTLLTHDCTAKFNSNHIIKFADDTTVVGLISNNDETHYREEVAQLAEWCGANNLSLNASKTKEVVVDFRRTNSIDHPPLTIDSSTVERVSSTKFLGVHITEDLTWSTNTMSLSKKAQQHLHFLRRLKRASLPPPILTTFYRGTIESVLTSCITVWYRNCSAADRKTLQRTVNTAAKITGAPLPSILDIFLARCSSKTNSIMKDPTHPSHTMSLSKKAQQRLHFLRRLKRASLPPPILTTFYRGTIESVLTSCITVWYRNCSAADRKTLQRTVNTAAKITGAPLPSILDIFLARCSSKTNSIMKDPTHPSHTMSLSKKAQQRLRFLRRLKRASLPPPILTTFYRGTIESVLTSCITVWYRNM